MKDKNKTTYSVDFEVECPLCKEMIPVDSCPHCHDPAFLWDRNKIPSLIQHISSHVLFNSSLNKTLQLCGLCFRPYPTCIIYLRKGKGAGSSIQVDLKKFRCPNLQKFSYQHAATGAPTSPCTNVPVECPLCPSTGAVWKYNIEAHFAKMHPSADFAQYSLPFNISNAEIESMWLVWKKRKVKQRSTKKSNKVPLPISEAHSTTRVFS